MIFDIENLNKAWQHRIDQEIDECLLLFSDIKLSVGYRGFSHFKEDYQRLSSLKIEEVSQILSLESSISRVQKNISQSKLILQELDRLLVDEQLVKHFYYLFEKSIAYFAYDSDWQNAMNFFLLAGSAAPNAKYRIVCQMNVVLCMENIGLSYSKTKQNIEQVLAETPNSNILNTFFKGVEARALFRNGDLKEYFQRLSVDENKQTQLSYFYAWTKLLSYHKFYDKKDLVFEELAQASPYFYNKNFRLRTLSGNLNPEDFREQEPSHLAERLYLWTWQWLQDPKQMPIEKIIELLKHFKLNDIENKITADDSHYFAHSLLWLSLFAPHSRRSIQKIANRVKRNTSPLMEVEFLVISYLLAKAQKQEHLAEDFITQLKQNNLFNSDSIEFSSLIQELGNKSKFSALDGLTQRINELLNPQLPNQKYGLYIDLETLTVIDLKTNERTLSESLCQALVLLKQQQSASFEQLLQVCFGLPEYDPVYHQTKINNLVARLKKTTDGLIDIKTKLGKVITTGDWNSIIVAESIVKRLGLAQSSEWKDIIINLDDDSRSTKPAINAMVEKHHKVQLKKEQLSEVLSRSELEIQLNLSKSTMNRRLQEWIDSGLIKRIGKGKKTQYKIVKRDLLLKNINSEVL